MLMGCFPKLYTVAAIKPRYKRLVDNIFPSNPDDGIIKLNMHKLRFYALSFPDELCMIGEYLCSKALVDANRDRYSSVKIAVDTMDRLLMSRRAFDSVCFVETFLEMNRRLLENANPKLQLAATESFLRFASVGEDIPSYHRRYDVFISRYSAMCQVNVVTTQLRLSIRMAGLKGLESVIKKTISDDLVQDIWESQHMEKIIPALIFNMQIYSSDNPNTPSSVQAGRVFRYLVSKSSFDHVQHLMEPLMQHFDDYQMWIPNEFPTYIFKIVMLSIEPYYSYQVINIFLDHLKMIRSVRVKVSIAEVLTRFISIGSGEFIGSAVYGVADRLLKLTNDALHSEDPANSAYRDNLIEALEQFSINQPDYQKVEIMSFILSDVLMLNKSESRESLMKLVLGSMTNVSAQCKVKSYQSAFPKPFLEKIMHVLAGDFSKEIKISTMNVLTRLLDRHDNCNELKSAPLETLMRIPIRSQSQQDITFAINNFQLILSVLTVMLTQKQDVELLESALTVAALLIIELGCREVNVQFMEFLMLLQHVAKTNDDMTKIHKINIHKIVIKLFAIFSQTSKLLQSHCQELISRRQMLGSILLPPLSAKETPSLKLFIFDELLLDSEKITEFCQNIQKENDETKHSLYWSLELEPDFIDSIFLENRNTSGVDNERFSLN